MSSDRSPFSGRSYLGPPHARINKNLKNSGSTRHGRLLEIFVGNIRVTSGDVSLHGNTCQPFNLSVIVFSSPYFLFSVLQSEVVQFLSEHFEIHEWRRHSSRT